MKERADSRAERVQEEESPEEGTEDEGTGARAGGTKVKVATVQQQSLLKEQEGTGKVSEDVSFLLQISGIFKHDGGLKSPAQPHMQPEFKDSLAAFVFVLKVLTF